MTDTIKLGTGTSSGNSPRRVLLSSFLGSTIEFYDFLLYASAASLVFGPVFFSNLNPVAATIASYATFATGYLARPLGGILFGHFGDRVGRKRMLVLSMYLMGISSTLIGVIPPSAWIGSWAAVLLVCLRLVQGIAVGGEWGGATLMALEHSDSKRRGFSASFTQAGAPAGVAVATLMLGLFAGLPEDQFLSWGWRIPFLFSAALLVLGLWVRLQISESPLFEAAMKAGGEKRRRTPLAEVLAAPKPLIFAVLSTVGNFILTTSISVYGVSYAAQHGSNSQTALFALSISNVVMIVMALLMGRLSDSLGRKPVMITGFVLLGLYMYPFFGWIGSGDSSLIVAAFVGANILQSLIYGPMAAYISEQFGTTSRYTGASLGYQGASLIGSGLTPLLLTSVYAATSENILSVLVITSVAAITSAVFLAWGDEPRDRNLQDL
ncbi:MFS transporter [Nocardia jinanensis]|uniref:MFS transporter n=1 Tax=Nocardia jinanensis TaxID=382504 RepID=A0A917VTJ3_9NOCA|nr:MFS transporter [Nocardia jinanensis]GGL12745.1 MFS transporter [Nocardia jinanensis]